MLIGNASERGDQDNHQKANQPHLCQVKRQPNNQHQGRHCLYPQGSLIGFRALGALVVSKLFQYLADRLGQPGAIPKPAQLFQQPAGGQAGHQHRQAHRRHAQEETDKVPPYYLGDQQVLGLAHHGGHSPQGRSNGAVHQQATQKGPELVQVFPVQLNHVFIAVGIMIGVMITLAGSYLVVHRVKTDSDTDDDCGDGKRVQERG